MEWMTRMAPLDRNIGKTALHPATPGSILRVPEQFSEVLGKNNSMLERFIGGPA